jgi:uncharacterized membrane protein
MANDPTSVPTDSSAFVPSSTLASSSRVDSIDLLRGLVMVLMALDHTRDFFGNAQLNPTDLSKATAALFMTRWVTHFCAPVFAFLAGTGAYLASASGRSRSDLARFLASRGLWLIFLDLTVMNFGLYFNPAPSLIFMLVLWSIGGSFLLLSALVYLPGRFIGAQGLLLIASHNFIELLPVSAGSPGALEPLRTLLFRPGLLPPLGIVKFFVGYPLLPWFGIVAAGYGFGEVIRLKPERRESITLTTGIAMTALFVAMRAWGVYGDPNPWTTEGTPLLTALSFSNCTKQPPSLLFVCMTLGPAMVALGIFDRFGSRGPVRRALVTLGRVPLFFYILHFYLIHALAVLVAIARGMPITWLCSDVFQGQPPPGWPFSLPGVYFAWAIVVILMYLPCRWFAGVKRRHPGGWLSYL